MTDYPTYRDREEWRHDPDEYDELTREMVYSAADFANISRRNIYPNLMDWAAGVIEDLRYTDDVIELIDYHVGEIDDTARLQAKILEWIYYRHVTQSDWMDSIRDDDGGEESNESAAIAIDAVNDK